MQEKEYFKIMAISPESFPGDMSKCYESLVAAIDKATSHKASLLLLPELCITSFSCGNLFSYELILASAEDNLLRLTEYTKDKEIICCFSFPMIKDDKIYDVAALTYGGQILGIVPLPMNRTMATNSFSEYLGEDSLVILGGQTIPFGEDLIFSVEEYKNLSICIGKSPEKCKSASVYLIPDALMAGIGRQKRVIDWCRYASEKNGCTVVYCSAGEGETNSCGVFSGQTVIAENGIIISESPVFGSGTSIACINMKTIIPWNYTAENAHDISAAEPEIIDYDRVIEGIPEMDNNPYPFLGEKSDIVLRCEEAFEIQSRGLAGRLRKTGISKAVLGISGGLDSTLALLVSIRAMEILGRGRMNIVAVSMPCFGTSDRTKTNAQILCEDLGVDFRLIDISDAVHQHLRDIGHDMVTADTAYENSQARERTQVLMDISNMEDGLVVGTGDMSEAALGWCTFNGDHMSMYNVNCSVTKSLVKAIVVNYAKKSDDPIIRTVLMDIIDTPISPELKPVKDGKISQKTEEIIGPYDVHDYYLYHFVRNRRSPEEILDLAYSAYKGMYTKEQIRDWMKVFLRRFIQNQFKRNCSPDGPSIGFVDISYNGLRLPSDLAAGFLLEQIK